jgi:MutS domain V
MLNNIQFKLPITYCDELYTLQEDVINDLELSDVIYAKVFKTENHFGNHVSKEWSKQFTSDIVFLEDTQNVVKNMNKFEQFSSIDTSRVIDIWNDTKCNSNFLEKYNYMDWEKLIHFNESPLFLQVMSSINLISPIISLVIPLVILILPFFILQMKGVRLAFNEYLRVLKDIAVNHFFKGQFKASEMGFDKIVYVIVYIALYVMQLYQNITTCNRFYKNIQDVNHNLIDFKEYLGESIKKMELFIDINKYDSYKLFCNDILIHLVNIKHFYNKLSNVTPFKIDMNKVNDCGYMLSCYYELKNNQQYDESFKFSIGFDGYIDNMKCIYNYINQGFMTNASFDNTFKKSIVATEQVYPPHIHLSSVITKESANTDSIKLALPTSNDIDLKNNIVITGPNASGKTTYLKTTAINIILSQQIGCGFYKKCTLNPFTRIHSYLNIPDTSGRDSLFQAESRRCKNILDTIDNSPPNSRHFCIFDELYTGTSPKEASRAAYSLLKYLNTYSNVNFILTTHYTELCKKLEKIDSVRRISNKKMNVIEQDGKIEYLYKISKGISRVQGTLRIFEEMNYPNEIIKCFTNQLS